MVCFKESKGCSLRGCQISAQLGGGMSGPEGLDQFSIGGWSWTFQRLESPPEEADLFNVNEKSCRTRAELGWGRLQTTQEQRGKTKEAARKCSCLGLSEGTGRGGGGNTGWGYTSSDQAQC